MIDYLRRQSEYEYMSESMTKPATDDYILIDEAFVRGYGWTDKNGPYIDLGISWENWHKLRSELKCKRVRMIAHDQTKSPIGKGVFECNVQRIGDKSPWIILTIAEWEEFNGLKDTIILIGLRILNDDEHVHQNLPVRKSKGDYGWFARDLFKQGFFALPEVREALGMTDTDLYRPNDLKEQLKTVLGIEHSIEFASLAEIPPNLIIEWAKQNSIAFAFLKNPTQQRHE